MSTMVLPVLLALLLLLLQQQINLAAPSQPKVPALFLFGDSLVDSGNNNALFTRARADFSPYGLNFADRRATGRFCDGMLFGDFLASYLGLPFPPPYMNVSSAAHADQGVNFASASSGIFRWTGVGVVLPLQDQVNAFRNVRNQLVRTQGINRALSLISNSIFFICTGNNDVNNMLHVLNSRLPIGSRDALLFQFSEEMHRLYSWGARKFVVVSLSAVGCIPMNQRLGRCAPTGVSSSIFYNTGLATVLSILRKTLPGAHIVMANLQRVMLEVKADPASYGFSNAAEACCPANEPWRWCYHGVEFCESADKYMFWDMVHPSQAFNRIAAQKWWNGSTEYAFPMNILQLANTQVWL